MAAREIICRNEDGMKLSVGEKGFSPFILCSADGIYGTSNDVFISNGGMLDGGVYHGSVAKVRDIMLTFKDADGAAANRDLLEEVFKPVSEGVLTYDDGSHVRMCRYYVESIDSDGAYGSRTYAVSLRCPDPFFYDAELIVLSASDWESSFTFEHEFHDAGEAFGILSNEKNVKIYNQSAAEGIGLEITLIARGPVTNPSVTLIETMEQMSIGTKRRPFSMATGDVVIITTMTNKKRVYLEPQGGERMKIIQYLSEDSKFIQLGRGMNTIGCTAESGADDITMIVTYRMRYLGA